MSEDVIELRLPSKPDYLPVLRATVGVIAGSISFTYDEIVQLRIAVSEAFDLAIKCIARGGGASTPNDLAVRFLVRPRRLEVLIPVSGQHLGALDTQEDLESKALLRSLADELEFGGGDSDRPLVRLVKHSTSNGV